MASSAAPAPRPAAIWVQATRPLYLPTSVVPALVGGLVAIGVDGARWWLLPVALLAVLLLHAAVNVTNDVEDYARGVDTEEKMDNSRVFTTGLMEVGAGRRLYLSLYAAAFALGVLICLFQGPELLVIGLAGILGGYLYTAGPQPYKYLGLGDLLIIWLMGPLLTQGAYTAVTGDPFAAPAFWIGLFPGLLICAVLACNNLSDIETDRAAGVRTLAVRLGFRRARMLALAALAGAYLVIPVLWLTGLFGVWILLVLLTAPPAISIARQAMSARTSPDDALLMLAPQTAQLHLMSGLVLAVAVVLDRI